MAKAELKPIHKMTFDEVAEIVAQYKDKIIRVNQIRRVITNSLHDAHASEGSLDEEIYQQIMGVLDSYTEYHEEEIEKYKMGKWVIE